MTVRLAMKGSGISAMPSMHIATATIFVLAARRTAWLVPAVTFWAMTFIGSVYLGYHYAVDAPVAAVVAALCWAASARLFHERPANETPREAFA
jgi:membrane-associated phospholipid phosphatase